MLALICRLCVNTNQRKKISYSYFLLLLLSVDEFEHSYNSQNAKLVIMDRIAEDPEIEFFRLDEASKEALNLKGEVSSEKPVFWRGDKLDFEPYDDEH